MKVSQNDETNPDTQPVRPPHIPSIANTQLSPLRLLCLKTQNTEDNFPDVPPFTGTTSYHVRAHLASRFVMSCIAMHLFALSSLFLPALLSLDIETDDAATQYDYGVDDPSLLPEQPGKPPPLITRYRLLSSILLALE